MPSRPPPQAAPEVDSRPAPRRHLPLDHPSRADLHHRTHPVPDLTVPRRVRGLSVRSRVAFFHGQTAQSPFDNRPEPGAFHRLASRALTAVLECGAGHLDTVLLLGQLGQLVIDHLPLALPLARDETPDLR